MSQARLELDQGLAGKNHWINIFKLYTGRVEAGIQPENSHQLFRVNRFSSTDYLPVFNKQAAESW